MAKNVSLWGASYSDVPAVDLPQTGGGTATFTDVSDTTATENDVLFGKSFYKSNGQKASGSISVPAVIDNLTSTSATDALSANQGKVLNDKISQLNFGDITSQCSPDWSKLNALKVYRFGNFVVVTGQTKSGVTGVDVSLVTLPHTVRQAWFPISAYNNAVVGEGFIADGSHRVRVNISSSTDVGSFCVMTYVMSET